MEDYVFTVIALFLWTTFSQFSLHFNTDMLHKLRSNPYFVHSFGFLCTLFLFHDPSIPLSILFVRSVVLYFSFLYLAKSRWPFMVVVITLFIVYDLIRRQVNFERQKEKKEEEKEEEEEEGQRETKNDENIDLVLLIIKSLAIIIIVAGIIDLSYRKKAEKKERFSWMKLLFGVREKFVFRSQLR